MLFGRQPLAQAYGREKAPRQVPLPAIARVHSRGYGRALFIAYPDSEQQPAARELH